MSLIGKLQDLSAIDVLQILSLSKRTGVLSIDSPHGRNNVLFKNGMIISASSPSIQSKGLGQILIERHLLSPSRLDQLLELQKQRGNEPLGSILLEAGVIQEESLREIIKDRIREALRELKSLTEGNFSFQSTEVVPFDDLELNPAEADVESGWHPRQLLEESENARAMRRKNKAIPFQPSVLKARGPAGNAQPVSYEEIRHAESPEALHLLDLQLPGTSEVPDIAFDLIAESIDFPISPATSNFAVIAAPAGAEQRKSAGTILLLEDEALLRQLMARRLREKGYEVFQTENPKEAIRMVRQMIANRSQFSVITDLVMPTSSGSGFLGGLEFIEAVRKLSTRIPILVMTDYEDARAQTRAYTLGVFDFHKKPIFSRSSIEEMEAETAHFTDTLLKALSQPPYALHDKTFESDFWADLKPDEKTSEQRGSVATMVRQMTDLQRAVSDFSSSTKAAPEISNLILTYAADFVERGLLFQVKKQEAAGITGFGETGDIESMPQKARRIRISLEAESIFAKVLREKHAHLGRLADTPLNRQFISLIGRLIPPAIAMVPLICKDNVVGFFYADNALSRKPIKDLEALEIFLAQAGLAMEHAALRRKMKSITFK